MSSPVHQCLTLRDPFALPHDAPSLSTNSTDQYYPVEMSTEKTHHIKCEPVSGLLCPTLYTATFHRKVRVNNELFKPIRTMPGIEHDSNTSD